MPCDARPIKAPARRRGGLLLFRRKVISLAPPIAYVCAMLRTTALLALLATPGHAATQEDVLSGTLLPGWQTEGGGQMAALDLVLAPGWKTYWRSPGDAGIPPSFDWSGSQNVRAIKMHWPAPSVFESNGLRTIGYHDRLILPVEIIPVDPLLPVVLSLRMELGVCDEICLPASLDLASNLLRPGAPDAGIRAALAQVARSASAAGVGDVSCTVDPIDDGLRLTARLRLPDPGSEEVVAFETADPAVWVAAAATSRQGIDLIAVTELVPPEGAPFALDRSGVTLTILSEDGAIEVRGCPAP